MTGVELIAAERLRQQAVCCWSAEHDDHHTANQLVYAALCYASPKRVLVMDDDCKVHNAWPWGHPDHYDHGLYIHRLAKAGALIAAEIDRLSRLGEDVGSVARTIYANS
jgi:hypothetical protein